MMNNDTFAIDSILNKASQALRKSGSLSPRLDCELLLAKVLCCTRLELYKNKKKCISIEEKALFDKLFFRRQKKNPSPIYWAIKNSWA